MYIDFKNQLIEVSLTLEFQTFVGKYKRKKHLEKRIRINSARRIVCVDVSEWSPRYLFELQVIEVRKSNLWPIDGLHESLTDSSTIYHRYWPNLISIWLRLITQPKKVCIIKVYTLIYSTFGGKNTCKHYRYIPSILDYRSYEIRPYFISI